jgi:PAS domain-containing protein
MFSGKSSMQDKWDGIERRKSLRVEAEAMVARFYPEHNAQESPDRLLHELLVHKVELELQNEELRLAYAAMQEMRDRYMDLYEFSPFGYLTINPKGLIAEINLTGADLLGQNRQRLLDSNFANLVIPEDQFRWRRHKVKKE